MVKSMTSLKKTLKDIFKPRERRALQQAIMIAITIAIGIGMLVAVSSNAFDILDTTSIVDALDVTNPALYAEQGFATVQVKNNGNTPIDNVYAVLLINDDAGGSPANCGPGTEAVLITGNVGALVAATTDMTNGDLNPGESITISGGFRTVAISADGTATAAAAANANLACDDANDIGDREEYIIQIIALNEATAGDELSTSITVRAR